MRLVLLFVCLLYFIPPANSQENQTTDTSEIDLTKMNLLLNEISIHTTLNIEDNKTQIIRLNQKEITSSLSKNPAELLEKSTAISVQKSQNGGGSPNIRGFEANRILLVLDGVKLNNTIYRSGHLQNILSIDPFILENISILHGPSTVFYGSGALGGSIILNTINPENYSENINSFSSQYESSSNSYLTHLHSVYKKNNTSFLSSATYKNYENLKMGINRFHGYENWGKDEFTTNGNTQLYSDYSQIDLTQKIHHKINNSSSFSINSQFSTTSDIHRYDKLNDVSNGSPKYESWYYGPQTRVFNSLSYSNNLNKILADKIDLNFNIQNIEESRHKQKFTDNFSTSRIENLDIFDSKISLRKNINNWQIDYGFSNRFEKLSSDAYNKDDSGDISFATSRYPDNGSEVLNFSTFILSEYRWNNKLKWFNAVRGDFEKIEAHFSDNNPFELNESLLLENWNIAASSNLFYSILENNFISFSIYNSFRNPNIDDLGKVFSKVDGIVVIPNPDLNSEKIISSELMFQHLGKNNKFDIVLFNSFLTDAIAKREISINGVDSILYDGEWMKTIANTNITSAKMMGVNLIYNQKINEKLSVKSISSFVNAISSDSFPLAHIPPLSSRLQFNYSVSENSSFSFYSIYNSWKKSEDFDLNGVDNFEEATIDGTPSWYTLNLIYSRKINNFQLSISCENILDAHYKTFASAISSSGRNFIVNLQSEF